MVEGTALMSHATSMALDQDLGPEAVRGLYNLAEDKMAAGRFAEAEELLERGLAVVNRRGDRHMERQLVAQGQYLRLVLGRWDEVLANADALRSDDIDDQWSFQALVPIPSILVNRGEMAQALELVQPLSADTGWAESTVMAQGARAVILREMGEAARALGDARQAALSVIDRSLSHTPVEFAEAVECAFDAQDTDVVRELLERIDMLKPVQLIPLLDAEAMRARGRLAAQEGDPESAQRWFRRSIDLFRELETPFLLARALLQYAELHGAADEASALRDEAVAAVRSAWRDTLARAGSRGNDRGFRMITCANCGAESPPGQRFCGQCGSPLVRVCASCGAENPPDNRFCGSCGSASDRNGSRVAGSGPHAGFGAASGVGPIRRPGRFHDACPSIAIRRRSASFSAATSTAAGR